MIRTLIVAVVALIVVWAPWMTSDGANALAEQVFEAFGPFPSVCYDSDERVVQEGLSVRWYPMGRLVHTCTGDYIVWTWGAVEEAGGVYKRSEDIRAVQGRALTCADVLERQEARRATSTDSELVYYDGAAAEELDFSIFPEAERQRSIIRNALRAGPTFAGKFAVAEWECGTGCQNHAVIDVETGLVIAFGPQTEHGVRYDLESTIMITNPIEHLPELPTTRYETESVALAIARLSREYYRLTSDALSGTQYLVRQCVESSATGYIEIEDDRIGVIQSDTDLERK